LKLEDVYRQIPESSCPDNCGKCCGLIFPSLAELRNIKEWCSSHHVEYKDFNMVVGLDCPYLGENKECFIYPVRPFLCRIMGVSIAIPCPIGKCQVRKLLNRPQSDALYKEIYLRGKEKPRTEKRRRIIRESIGTIEKFRR